MTVQSTVNKITHLVSDIGQTEYIYDFRVDAANYMIVYLNDVEQSPGDYTVNDLGSLTGGTITISFTTALDDQLLVLREMPLTQLLDYITYGKFPSTTHEKGLDYGVMIDQQLQEQYSRVMRFPVYEDVDPILPSPQDDYALVWEGNALVNKLYANSGGEVLIHNDHDLNGRHLIFESVDNLRASTFAAFDGQLIDLSGYNSYGDKGGQALYYDSSSSETDDGVSIFKRAGDTSGRFKSVDTTVLNAFHAGLKGDGTTEDVNRFYAYIDFVLAGSGDAYFPGGTYTFAEKLEVSSSATSLVIRGDGKRNTAFFWDSIAASEGIEITYVSEIWSPKVNGMSFLTGSLASGTGLKIIGPGVASSTYLGPAVYDLEASGANTSLQGWGTGIEFDGCWNIQYRNVTIKGQDGVHPFACTNGLLLTNCVVIFASDFGMWHVTNAVKSNDTNKGEGYSFSDFELVGVTNGMVLHSSGNNAPGTNIGPGHINAYELCIDLIAHDQTSIHNLLLYKTSNTALTWVGIKMSDCDGNHIHDNELHGSATTTGDTTGMIVKDTHNCVIHDNVLRGFSGANKNGIFVYDSSDINHIHNNVADVNPTYVVLIDPTAGLNNIITDNYPNRIETFDVNDATPSVANSISGDYNTANTGATSVTDFDDGYTTQVIIILVNDSNTTFVHDGVNLSLAGSANYAATDGSTITFRQDSGGGLWREISRSEH